jgi:hypothetical protein
MGNLLLFMIIPCSYQVLLITDSRVLNSITPITLTILVVWLITRYYDTQNTYLSDYYFEKYF